jgi:hypothetical protein
VKSFMKATVVRVEMSVCPIEACKYKTLLRNVMAKHIVLHSEAHYKCSDDNCFYITKNLSNLKVHTRIAHGSCQRLICPNDCGYASFDVSNHKRHIRTCRILPKPLPVDIDFEFKNLKPSIIPSTSTGEERPDVASDIVVDKNEQIREYLNSILLHTGHSFPNTVSFGFVPEEVELVGDFDIRLPDKHLAIVVDTSTCNTKEAKESCNAAFCLISNRSGPRMVWLKGVLPKLSGLEIEACRKMSNLFSTMLTRRCFPLNVDHEAASSHAHIKADLEDPEQTGTKMKYGKLTTNVFQQK